MEIKGLGVVQERHLLTLGNLRYRIKFIEYKFGRA